MTAFRFAVNGTPVEVDVPGMRRLLDVLREELVLTGTKEGCGEGECGACSVLKNGQVVNSCILPVAQAEGSYIVTMAGLRETDRGKTLIQAFAREGAVQCGFCIPGMVIAADALLAGNPSPSEREIREGISGNLCRCTGYDLIVRAVSTAAREGRGRW